MISTLVYTWPEHGDVEYILSKFPPRGQTEDCYWTQRSDSRHSNDENGMFCGFLFDLSTFCPSIFCKIIKIKIIKCKNKIF